MLKNLIIRDNCGKDHSYVRHKQSFYKFHRSSLIFRCAVIHIILFFSSKFFLLVSEISWKSRRQILIILIFTCFSKVGILRSSIWQTTPPPKHLWNFCEGNILHWEMQTRPCPCPGQQCEAGYLIYYTTLVSSIRIILTDFLQWLWSAKVDQSGYCRTKGSRKFERKVFAFSFNQEFYILESSFHCKTSENIPWYFYCLFLERHEEIQFQRLRFWIGYVIFHTFSEN